MTPLLTLIAFGILTLVVLYVDILTTYLTQGFGFGFSSNRPVIEKVGFQLRSQRSLQNQVESAAYIVPALLVALLPGGLDSTSILVSYCCLGIVVGRIGFIGSYYFGIPFVRAVFFGLAFVAAATMLVAAGLTQI